MPRIPFFTSIILSQVICPRKHKLSKKVFSKHANMLTGQIIEGGTTNFEGGTILIYKEYDLVYLLNEGFWIVLVHSFFPLYTMIMRK